MLIVYDCIASRIYAPTSDFFMTTGAALPVYGEGGQKILQMLESQLKKGHASIRSFIEEDPARFSTWVIRTLLASGTSERIAYEEEFVTSSPPALPTIHSTTGPRRNSVCSCGSGKRFKRCCGRKTK
jgi:hypothetical protein